MRFEEFLMVSNYCLFSVERLKKGLWSQHGVRVPLLWKQGEGRDAKSILVEYVVGAAAEEPLEGRPALEKRQLSRDFDATKGFPGEDVASCCERDC